jgi:hypothetical protein
LGRKGWAGDWVGGDSLTNDVKHRSIGGWRGGGGG